MLRLMDQLVVMDGVLYRKRMNTGEPLYQLVLPQKYREVALEALHDSVGHMGVERTLDLVRTRFYWPRMSLDVEIKISTCERCIKRKAKAGKAFPRVNIETSRHLELVYMDYLSLEPDDKGTKNILVITDHFTKYAVAIPTADQKARTVAKALWNNFFIHYGIPEQLHSDQGRDFESAVIKDLVYSWVLRRLGPLLTTHVGIPWNGSIELFSKCSEPFKKKTRSNCVIMCSIWFMPITARKMTQLVSLLTS